MSRCEGYANYQTYATDLRIKDDRKYSGAVVELVGEMVLEGTNSFYDIAQAIGEWWLEIHEDDIPASDGGWVGDIVDAAIEDIDWCEIAYGFVVDMADDDDPFVAANLAALREQGAYKLAGRRVQMIKASELSP